MMEQIISWETAVLAKQKRFNLYTDKSYWGEELTAITPGYSLEDGTTSQENYYEFPRYYAPTQSLLQKWLREVHKIEVSVIPAYDSIIPKVFDMSKIKWNNVKAEYFCFVNDNREEAPDDDIDDFMCFHTTYEEALEAGLYEALKLIK